MIAAGRRRMKRTAAVLQGIHWFVGIGAIAGGIAALVNPLNPMGVGAEALEHAPFDTFLIPGLFLLIVLGAGNCLGALTGIRYPQWRGYLAAAFGAVLVLWIVIQCIMLRSVVLLHVLYLLIGVFQSAMGLKLMRRN